MRGRRGKTAAGRWVALGAALGLGVLLALGGLWALVSGGPGGGGWSAGRPTAPAAAPLDDIDSASRGRLDDVLRRAEREEARP